MVYTLQNQHVVGVNHWHFVFLWLHVRDYWHRCDISDGNDGYFYVPIAFEMAVIWTAFYKKN